MPKKNVKVRLDVLLVERGILSSRQAAQAAIMDGGVLVDGQKIDKPGTPVAVDAELVLTKDWQPCKYVSRGGLKLEKALELFNIDVKDRICLDIGASTGGFTDCLLQHQARHVYAIDVGYGQIVGQLRQDERVTVKERVNARYLTAEQLYPPGAPWADLAVFDVSFIALNKVLPACLALLVPPKDMVALVKPQFEAGRGDVGKGGVVKSQETHQTVISNVINFARDQGLAARGLTYSPIKGASGNVEFLLYLSSAASGLLTISDSQIADVVARANGDWD